MVKDGFYYAVDRATGKLLFASPPLVPTSNTYRYPTKEGILHQPGELRIEFFGAEDLLRHLFELSQAMINDYARFQAAVEERGQP